MATYKFKNHRVENGRLILLFDKISWFGFVKEEVEFIDSKDVYKQMPSIGAWFTYPDFIILGWDEKAVAACEGAKKYLVHSKVIQEKVKGQKND